MGKAPALQASSASTPSRPGTSDVNRRERRFPCFSMLGPWQMHPPPFSLLLTPLLSCPRGRPRFVACERLEGRGAISLLRGAEHRRLAGEKGIADSKTKGEVLSQAVAV